MLPPESAAAIAGSIVAGLAMLQVSLGTKTLTWRPPRKCPSCGRLVRGTCPCCE
jgi:hypothetical protein